ncbi:MAG: formylglycine-generating enzyme family protein, partial [Pirellulaceae bacterium]
WSDEFDKHPIAVEETDSASSTQSVEARSTEPQVFARAQVLPGGRDKFGAWAEFAVEGVRARLRYCPPGQFTMGSPEDEPGHWEFEGHPLNVTLAKAFWMMETPVTQALYEAVMGNNPSNFKSPTRPVEQVSWDDAQEFVERLHGRVPGLGLRLPSEAEWEYACRAGTTTAYSFGDDPADLDDYGWYFDNTDGGYEKVGTKKPNPWGLHDMHGNVSEWVLDQYDEEGYESVLEESNNPLNVPMELYPRVVRGGAWDQFPEDCRSAARQGSDEEWKKQDPQLPKSIWYHTDALHVGFRIVRPLKVPTLEARQSKWEKSEPVQLDMEK